MAKGNKNDIQYKKKDGQQQAEILKILITLRLQCDCDVGHIL
jgi:hypothetical protein